MTCRLVIGGSPPTNRAQDKPNLTILVMQVLGSTKLPSFPTHTPTNHPRPNPAPQQHNNTTTTPDHSAHTPPNTQTGGQPPQMRKLPASKQATRPNYTARRSARLVRGSVRELETTTGVVVSNNLQTVVATRAIELKQVIGTRSARTSNFGPTTVLPLFENKVKFSV